MPKLKLKQWSALDCNSNSFQLLIHIFSQILPRVSHLLRQHRSTVFQPGSQLPGNSFNPFLSNFCCSFFFGLLLGKFILSSRYHKKVLHYLTGYFFFMNPLPVHGISAQSLHIWTPYEVDLCLGQNCSKTEVRWELGSPIQSNLKNAYNSSPSPATYCSFYSHKYSLTWQFSICLKQNFWC